MIHASPLVTAIPVTVALTVTLLPACGQAAAQETKVRPYSIPATEVHRFESRAVGDVFEVNVALPLSYAETNREYPLVIGLDADLAFGAATQTARLMQLRQELPDFLLVGIGYGDLGIALEKRRRDFTPTIDEGDAACSSAGGCGGAEQFAEFLESELLPFIAERYRVDLGDRTLIGNSLGGLFGCYVLLRRPQLFGRYVLGSPTVSWDDAWVIRMLRDSALKAGFDARVYIGVGGEEGAGVAGSRTFADTLQKLDPARFVKFEVFEGERHMSVQLFAVSRGLREVFGAAPGEELRPGR